MPFKNYEFRFELKAGRFVYIQTEQAALRARVEVRRILRAYSPHDIFYHFRKRGGHISALKLHQTSRYFSRFDIVNFFGQVTRTKVARALREVGISHRRSFRVAVESVVVDGVRKVVPYGFVQSPLLCTLALEKSHFGGELIRLHEAGFRVSVYMDDVLVSCDDQSLLVAASNALLDAARLAGFPLSTEKLAIASDGAESFNCHIEASVLTVVDERMKRFVEHYYSTSELGQEAIERYIASVSPEEFVRFRSLLTASP